MPRKLLEDNAGSAFFDIENDFPDSAIEMWKCDDCDNLMAFDEPVNRVTRYLQRCSISEAAQAVSDERGFLDGYVYSNLLYDHVARHFSGRDCSPYAVEKRELRYDGTLTPLVTPKVMDEEIFSHKNGRFRHWWYGKMGRDCLILYSEAEMVSPTRLWRVFEPDWSAFDYLDAPAENKDGQEEVNDAT